MNLNATQVDALKQLLTYMADNERAHYKEWLAAEGNRAEAHIYQSVLVLEDAIDNQGESK